MKRTATARSLDGLVAAGALAPERAAALGRVADRYAIAVTPYLLDQFEGAEPDSPLARQYLPSLAELEVTPEERADPIGDDAWSPVKGIVHRYPDRVLLKALHACPVYCRFCFRREMVGPGGDALDATELAAALDYIRQRNDVWEVILTGGDPLMLSPRRLEEIVSALDAMPHVGVIRFHTRVPVADPERISADLLAALKVSDSAVWVAVHCNHPDELTAEATAALGKLADAGIPLVSQSVLLRGVNDDAAVLEALFRGLVRARVKPYYLHHGDLAPGTAHFRTGLDEGRELVKRLRGRVSGLCQPAYVLDIPGGHGKAPVGPDCLSGDAEAGYVVEDYRGMRHAYPPVTEKL
jgi:lysine 2,3-aminomutase